MLFWSPILGALFLLLYAIAGLTIGAISGWLTSLATKQNSKELRKNTFLGVVGFFVGLFGTIFMPWHENTITERLYGGGIVTTTMNTYQHPVRVAALIAFLLPMIFEAFRSRRRTTAS